MKNQLSPTRFRKKIRIARKFVTKIFRGFNLFKRFHQIPNTMLYRIMKIKVENRCKFNANINIEIYCTLEIGLNNLDENVCILTFLSMVKPLKCI